MPEPEYVPGTIIRQIFNEGQFADRVRRGELRARVFDYNNHLGRRARQKLRDRRTGRAERKRIRSQMVGFYEAGKLVALVHQYRRRDGSIRGRPDPKWIAHKGRILKVRQAP